MEARCQCGAVTFKTPLPQPLALYICHCDECKRQTSSAFGTSAIFPAFQLPDSELLRVYTRPTASGHTLYCYFCRACGVRLIHTIPGKNVLSVKGGCIQGLDWNKAIHIWTKSAMVPIPESSESHLEEPEWSDYSSSQEMLDQPMGLQGSGGWEGEEEELAVKSAQASATSDTSATAVSGACELSGAPPL